MMSHLKLHVHCTYPCVTYMYHQRICTFIINLSRFPIIDFKFEFENKYSAAAKGTAGSEHRHSSVRYGVVRRYGRVPAAALTNPDACIPPPSELELRGAVGDRVPAASIPPAAGAPPPQSWSCEALQESACCVDSPRIDRRHPSIDRRHPSIDQN